MAIGIIGHLHDLSRVDYHKIIFISYNKGGHTIYMLCDSFLLAILQGDTQFICVVHFYSYTKGGHAIYLLCGAFLLAILQGDLQFMLCGVLFCYFIAGHLSVDCSNVTCPVLPSFCEPLPRLPGTCCPICGTFTHVAYCSIGTLRTRVSQLQPGMIIFFEKAH